ncbi:MAG: phosphoribosyltransferase-like protein [Ktedonobacteraceae bacterium]
MPITSCITLLQSLTDTIADYRQGEVSSITPDHVERWLNQFEPDDQLTILTEMASLMKRFYFSKTRVKECLRNFLKNDLIAAHDPLLVLPRINFLQIQRDSNSQKTMLGCVDEILLEDYGLSLAICGTRESNHYM